MDSLSSQVAAGTDPDAALDELLRQIVSGFFVLTDGQGALSKWSEPAEMLFGMPAEDALGQPFFGHLVDPSALAPLADGWRAFLERGEVPGERGIVTVDANRPGGGTFPVEAAFIPVKLDEGFDFSLFLEDLSFELPMDLMLLRMRQQHPVVIKALRGALADQPQVWEGWRTAGTLVAFRPLVATPWVDDAMRRREEEAAVAEEELQSRIQAYEMPEVQGTDVYDLEDARAVIDRLKWATERIEDLEERSRVVTDAAREAADARLRAEAAERAAMDARAELAGAIADRPVDASGEAERLELLARVERVERVALQADEAAAALRLNAEADRARAAQVEDERAQLAARLSRLEQASGGGDQVRREAAAIAAAEAQAAVERAREEIAARMAALERSEHHDLAGRLHALEEARAQEGSAIRAQLAALAEQAGGPGLAALQARIAGLEAAGSGAHDDALAQLRAELDALRAAADGAADLQADVEALRAAAAAAADLATDVHALRASAAAAEELRGEVHALRADLNAATTMHADVDGLRHELSGAAELRGDLEALRAGLGVAGDLRAELDALRERTETAEAALRGGAEREARAAREAEAARAELAAALQRVEQVAQETARLRAHVETAPEHAPLSPEDRRRLEDAHRDAEQARAGLDALRAQAEELRSESAGLREEAGHLQARVNALSDGEHQARHDADALRREHEEIRAWLEDARRERDEARQHLREALLGTEELRLAFEREAREAPQRDAEAAAARTQSQVGSFIDGTRHDLHDLHEQATAARLRLEQLAGEAEDAARRAEDARAEAAAARGETSELRDEVREAQRVAREVDERIDLVDRGAASVLAEVRAQKTAVEALGTLARTVQEHAADSLAEAGRARALVEHLEHAVAAVREHAERAVVEAAGAREIAAGAEASATALHDVTAGVDEAARRAAAEALAPLAAELAELRQVAGSDPELRVALEALRADVEAAGSLRGELEGLRAELRVDELRHGLDTVREDLRRAAAPVQDLRAELAEAREAHVAPVEALRQQLAEAAAPVDALRAEVESLRGASLADAGALEDRIAALEAASVAPAVPDGLDARLDGLRESLNGALGRLETLSVDVGAARSESAATRTALEQRLADTTAELMAARAEAETTRRGLDSLREELSSLREYAAGARAEAAAAKEAAAAARKAAASDERRFEELRTELKVALATMADHRKHFDEARQAAVAARREAEAARQAADRVGAANEKTTEVWKELLGGRSTPPKPPSAPKAAEPEVRVRAERAGFDDQVQPMAVLDLKGRFTELNPAFSKLVGYREHQFGKATWPSVLDRGQYKAQVAEMQALIAGELDAVPVQSTYMHGQGLMVPIEGEIRLLRDEAGEPTGLLMTAQGGG